MALSLKVGIIGAGIAGLSAAISLSNVGHEVELYEKSKFKSETGAAILIGPNGTKILSRWGFDFEKAGALDYTQMRRIKADTIELDSEERFDSVKEKYGDRWLMFHRADLHAGLRAIAEPLSKIHLGQFVAEVDVEGGIITLQTGQVVEKDLVVVADGAHGELISRVLGRPSPVSRSPMSMYRFLQPMANVLHHPEAGKFFKDQPPGFTTFYKTEVGRPGLLLNTYPCRAGEQLYVALVHPTKPKEKGLEGWDSPADYQDVLADSKGFHPSVQAICEDASDVRVYTQMWRDPIETFTKGKAVLIGDAAHLMLPTHGQGAAMALEDAAALGTLLRQVESAADLSAKLTAFDRLRLPRVGAVQTMSNKMMGPPDKMISEIKRYYNGAIPGPQAKTFSEEYNDFFFLYDVADEARTLATVS